jgi:hypothetical protein
MERDGLINMVSMLFSERYDYPLSLPPHRLGGTSYRHHSAARQYLTSGLSLHLVRERELRLTLSRPELVVLDTWYSFINFSLDRNDYACSAAIQALFLSHSSLEHSEYSRASLIAFSTTSF